MLLMNLHDKKLSAKNDRLIRLLSNLRHFESLSPNIVEQIAEIATCRHFRAGQVIYLEGDVADKLYILEKGWIKATRISREGREQAMLFLEAGEIFGDIAVFSETTYPGTVTALEDVDVWEIPAQEFLQLIQELPLLAMAIIRHLSDRVLHYIKLVEDLSLRDVEARLANTLLQHAELINGSLLVRRRQWTTFDEMAVRLGTVRDVLSRVLKKLESEGLLKVEKESIQLLDPKGLAQRGKL